MKMKKMILGIVAVTAVLALTACGSDKRLTQITM